MLDIIKWRSWKKLVEIGTKTKISENTLWISREA